MELSCLGVEHFGAHDQIFQSVGTLIVFAMKRGVQFDERFSSVSEGVVVVHDVLSHFTILNLCAVQRNKSTVLCEAGIAQSV